MSKCNNSLEHNCEPSMLNLEGLRASKAFGPIILREDNRAPLFLKKFKAHKKSS
jgi:hypothetical protein